MSDTEKENREETTENTSSPAQQEQVPAAATESPTPPKEDTNENTQVENKQEASAAKEEVSNNNQNAPSSEKVVSEEKGGSSSASQKEGQPGAKTKETTKNNEQPSNVSTEKAKKSEKEAPKDKNDGTAAVSSLQTKENNTLQIPDYDDVERDRDEVGAEVSELRPTIVDHCHDLFLFISIPLFVCCGIIAIVLYSIKYENATTISHVVAGYCAVSASFMTLFLILLHLSVYTNPVQQRYIVRIVLMVPIYAIDSFLALASYKSATIIGLVRDTYEAYVIYMFFRLLMDYLGGEDAIVKAWETEQPTMKHMFPLGCILPPLNLTQRTLNIWKVCLVQYMILNPLLTLICVPLYYTDHYKDGDFDPKNSYVYFAAIRFVSVTFAFTSLVYFFFGCKQFLLPHKPLYKFAAIKTVVFLSFWQTVLLGGLNHFHVIPHSNLWTSEQVSTGLGNFVICIEMYIISICHRWIFSDEPYIPATGVRLGLKCWIIGHVFSISDVVTETQETLLSKEALKRERYLA